MGCHALRDHAPDATLQAFALVTGLQLAQYVAKDLKLL